MSSTSVKRLENAIAMADKSARPMTQALFIATLQGRDLLERVEYSSRTCGRQWTLAQCRKRANTIVKELGVA